MLMNLFDMFDVDNDGLLSHMEFDAYCVLSGSGHLKNEVDEKLKNIGI